jgi:hypothetical protein
MEFFTGMFAPLLAMAGFVEDENDVDAPKIPWTWRDWFVGLKTICLMFKTVIWKILSRHREVILAMALDFVFWLIFDRPSAPAQLTGASDQLLNGSTQFSSEFPTSVQHFNLTSESRKLYNCSLASGVLFDCSSGSRKILSGLPLNGKLINISPIKLGRSIYGVLVTLRFLWKLNEIWLGPLEQRDFWRIIPIAIVLGWWQSLPKDFWEDVFKGNEHRTELRVAMTVGVPVLAVAIVAVTTILDIFEEYRHLARMRKGGKDESEEIVLVL